MKLIKFFFVLAILIIGWHINADERQAVATGASWETAEVKFFRVFDYFIPYEYHIEHISYVNLLEDTIKFLNLHTGIEIINIFYQGSMLIVDLHPNFVTKMDHGSLGGAVLSNMVLHTFASFPEVEEIKFLKDGMEGVSGWHFDLSGIFRAEDIRQQRLQSGGLLLR